MFGLFKKKSELDKLQDKYNSLMKEWHQLSSINRAESDKKYTEANAILEQMDLLKKT